MIKSFENKTIIITGASAGVGAACARLFANHKAKLVLVARGEADLDRKSTRLNSSYANSSYAVFCLQKKTHESVSIEFSRK